MGLPDDGRASPTGPGEPLAKDRNKTPAASSTSLSNPTNSDSIPRDRSAPARTHPDPIPQGTAILSSMASPTSRKRTSNTARFHDPGPSSAEESAPIIQSAQLSSQNYNSISPSTSARTSSADGAARENQQREAAEREAAQQERRERGKWRAWADKYGSVELENKGSVARDHLALGTFVLPLPSHHHHHHHHHELSITSRFELAQHSTAITIPIRMMKKLAIPLTTTSPQSAHSSPGSAPPSPSPPSA